MNQDSRHNHNHDLDHGTTSDYDDDQVPSHNPPSYEEATGQLEADLSTGHAHYPSNITTVSSPTLTSINDENQLNGHSRNHSQSQSTTDSRRRPSSGTGGLGSQSPGHGGAGASSSPLSNHAQHVLQQQQLHQQQQELHRQQQQVHQQRQQLHQQHQLQQQQHQQHQHSLHQHGHQHHVHGQHGHHPQHNPFDHHQANAFRHRHPHQHPGPDPGDHSAAHEPPSPSQRQQGPQRGRGRARGGRGGRGGARGGPWGGWGAPWMPHILNMPNIPYMPQIPQIPQIPGLQHMPYVPNIPGMQALMDLAGIDAFVRQPEEEEADEDDGGQENDDGEENDGHSQGSRMPPQSSPWFMQAPPMMQAPPFMAGPPQPFMRPPFMGGLPPGGMFPFHQQQLSDSALSAHPASSSRSSHTTRDASGSDTDRHLEGEHVVVTPRAPFLSEKEPSGAYGSSPPATLPPLPASALANGSAALPSAPPAMFSGSGSGSGSESGSESGSGSGSGSSASDSLAPTPSIPRGSGTRTSPIPPSSSLFSSSTRTATTENDKNIKDKSVSTVSSAAETENFLRTDEVSSAVYEVTKKGVVESRDPILDDPYQLYRFFVAHNDPPAMHVLITGYHTERRKFKAQESLDSSLEQAMDVTDILDGMKEQVVQADEDATPTSASAQPTRTRKIRVNDFKILLDMAPYISATGSLYTTSTSTTTNAAASSSSSDDAAAVVSSHSGKIPTLRELFQDHVNEDNPFKELYLTKQVVWDYKSLTDLILNTVRQDLGYPYAVEVSFPISNHQVLALSSSPLAVLLRSKWTKLWSVVSCLGVLIYPLRELLKKVNREGLRAEFQMSVTPQQFLEDQYWKLVEQVQIRKSKGG